MYVYTMRGRAQNFYAMYSKYVWQIFLPHVRKFGG